MSSGKSAHAFSVEMKSKEHVRHMSISNGSHDQVLFEGSLGELEGLSLVEGEMLEIRGANGTLRIDLSESELVAAISPKKEEGRR